MPTGNTKKVANGKHDSLNLVFPVGNLYRGQCTFQKVPLLRVYELLIMLSKEVKRSVRRVVELHEARSQKARKAKVQAWLALAAG